MLALTALYQVESDHKALGLLRASAEEERGKATRACAAAARQERPYHPGGNPWTNPKSFSHRCYPILVAFAWELTQETIEIFLGYIQGGSPTALITRPHTKLEPLASFLKEWLKFPRGGYLISWPARGARRTPSHATL